MQWSARSKKVTCVCVDKYSFLSEMTDGACRLLAPRAAQLLCSDYQAEVYRMMCSLPLECLCRLKLVGIIIP